MNDKMSFKMGMKFAAPFYMGSNFEIFCMNLEVKINQNDVR